MQVGSRLDHGGTWFQAITAEVGYAKTRYAYFNGVRMTLTATEPMYLDSDNIVDGYIVFGHMKEVNMKLEHLQQIPLRQILRGIQ